MPGTPTPAGRNTARLNLRDEDLFFEASTALSSPSQGKSRSRSNSRSLRMLSGQSSLAEELRAAEESQFRADDDIVASLLHMTRTLEECGAAKGTIEAREMVKNLKQVSEWCKTLVHAKEATEAKALEDRINRNRKRKRKCNPNWRTESTTTEQFESWKETSQR